MIKWIAKAKLGKVYLCSKTEVTEDYTEATRYDHIGDAMRACIAFNDYLGHAVFKIVRIHEKD